MIDKDAYIKKLERKIHNQRVALRENWQIVETRMNHKPTPLYSVWWGYVKKLTAENRELRRKLNDV